ncbi:hypothetical protein PMIN06_004147 [Paraphaeosphaeria minitans]
MVNKIQTVATNRPASRQTAMTTAVPSAYKPALTTNAPIRNPRLHPETGDLRQRSHSDHVTPSNKLLDARRFLLRYPIGCMPQYASLKPRQQAKLKGSIALLRRSTNRDYTLRSKHVQSYTYRRALMAPREAARVRKVRKVLGRYGPRITDEQFHEAVRKRRKRGTLIGGKKEDGGMWVSPAYGWVSHSHRQERAWMGRMRRMRRMGSTRKTRRTRLWRWILAENARRMGWRRLIGRRN